MSTQTQTGPLLVSDQRRDAQRTFRQGDTPSVRRFTQAFGARAGIAPGPLTDFVLAVSEAAAACATGGPGRAKVRLWLDGARAYCEVQANGLPVRRAAPGRGPGPRQAEEQSLRRWVLRRLSDHVSVDSGPDGVRVLLSMTVSLASEPDASATLG